MPSLFPRPFVAIAAATMLLVGCISGERELSYLGDAALHHYKDVATEIAYPHIHEAHPDEVQMTAQPHTVLDRNASEVRDITLDEATRTALTHNSVIRNLSEIQSGMILSNPSAIPSVYDPAIQESGYLFFGRGLESALAAFDTQFTTTMIWGRNTVPQNRIPRGTTYSNETGAFHAELSKQFATGGLLSLSHDMSYLGTNTPGLMFPSAYTGAVSAEYRHPLLAGAGTEFTRIAGPIAQSFGGITGTNQGVVIARINNDLALADFELNVNNLILDVEKQYWNLYLAYRFYDTAVTARNSALRTWRESKAKLDIGGVAGFKPADEAQARDQYFLMREKSEEALAGLYDAEGKFRRLLGLPVNDGTILRPSDEPVTAQFIPDWESCLAEALTRRVELRRQKWNIKSLDLQLKAARSLTRPRLDFVAGYQVNGYGDKLLSSSDVIFDNAYGTMTQNDHTGWSLGFECTMPIGFRQAHAQVRNLELQLAKARDILAAQELEISHELGDAFETLAEHYVRAQSSFNRRQAALQRVELYDAEVRAGTVTVDLLLRAQSSLAEAETAYYKSLVEYNQWIASTHYYKGSILDYNNVHLAEGGWSPEAYQQALRRAWARSHAFDADHLFTEPEELDLDCFDCRDSCPVLQSLPVSEPLLPAELNPPDDSTSFPPEDSAESSSLAPEDDESAKSLPPPPANAPEDEPTK